MSNPFHSLTTSGNFVSGSLSHRGREQSTRAVAYRSFDGFVRPPFYTPSTQTSPPSNSSYERSPHDQRHRTSRASNLLGSSQRVQLVQSVMQERDARIDNSRTLSNRIVERPQVNESTSRRSIVTSRSSYYHQRHAAETLVPIFDMASSSYQSFPNETNNWMRGIRNNRIRNLDSHQLQSERRVDYYCYGVPPELLEILPVERCGRDSLIEEQRTCLICHFDYIDGDSRRRLPCLHHFHPECIDHWLQNHVSCPVCRISVFHGIQNCDLDNRYRSILAQLESGTASSVQFRVNRAFNQPLETELFGRIQTFNLLPINNNIIDSAVVVRPSTRTIMRCANGSMTDRQQSRSSCDLLVNRPSVAATQQPIVSTAVGSHDQPRRRRGGQNDLTSNQREPATVQDGSRRTRRQNRAPRDLNVRPTENPATLAEGQNSSGLTEESATCTESRCGFSARIKVCPIVAERSIVEQPDKFEPPNLLAVGNQSISDNKESGSLKSELSQLIGTPSPTYRLAYKIGQDLRGSTASIPRAMTRSEREKSIIEGANREFVTTDDNNNNKSIMRSLTNRLTGQCLKRSIQKLVISTFPEESAVREPIRRER